MLPYSYKHKHESIIDKKSIVFYIPDGLSTSKKDWYPFMMFHNADKGFSQYSKRNLSLTILYNFGHFELKEGASSYYNPNSPYYSSFYGGYTVYDHENPNNAYGFFDNNKININELTQIPKYDQTKLVLPSLGCPESKIAFNSTIDCIEYNVNYLGTEGWTKIDSTIKTTSPIHKFSKNYLGYIQYGKPIEKYFYGESFPIITLKGRIYVKYIVRHKMTFILYVLASDKKTVDECDKNILSKSIIK